jgi:hypothetical protein
MRVSSGTLSRMNWSAMMPALRMASACTPVRGKPSRSHLHRGAGAWAVAVTSGVGVWLWKAFFGEQAALCVCESERARRLELDVWRHVTPSCEGACKRVCPHGSDSLLGVPVFLIRPQRVAHPFRVQSGSDSRLLTISMMSSSGTSAPLFM